MVRHDMEKSEADDCYQTLNEFHFTTEDAEDTEDFYFSSVPSVSFFGENNKKIEWKRMQRYIWQDTADLWGSAIWKRIAG